MNWAWWLYFVYTAFLTVDSWPAIRWAYRQCAGWIRTVTLTVWLLCWPVTMPASLWLLHRRKS